MCNGRASSDDIQYGSRAQPASLRRLTRPSPRGREVWLARLPYQPYARDQRTRASAIRSHDRRRLRSSARAALAVRRDRSDEREHRQALAEVDVRHLLEEAHVPAAGASRCLSTECAQWWKAATPAARSAGGALSSNARDKVRKSAHGRTNGADKERSKGSSAARKAVAASHRARADCAGAASNRGQRALA